MFLLVWVLMLTQAVNCGHFLFWMPFSTKSVKINQLEPGYELARRGHQVTVVTPFKNKKEIPGVTEIIHGYEALSTAFTEKQLTEKVGMPFQDFIEVSIQNNRIALTTPEVRALLHEEVKIDAVIVAPVAANEAGFYIARRKNASLVTFMTAPVSIPSINWAIGDTYNPSFTPFLLFSYSNPMSFIERCINTLATSAYTLANDLWIRRKVESLLSEQFPGEEIPSIGEMSHDIALHINQGSPFLGDGLRPVMPKSIMAGLMTCRKPRELPKDLNDFIQGAEHGVIYVSFGSVIKASKMPEDKRQLLLSVFAKLKQKIIWKWEADMPDAPDNVMISSWLPQQDLLGHPKVVMFITHGGAGSVQETICHKTPIVGVPISTDQYMNIAEALKGGLGESVDWHSLEAETLEIAVRKVLDNPRYQEAINNLSDLIMDQPQHPLERTVWWLEYLLRHPHNPGMRNPSLHLSWAQYFLLDIMAFFLIIISIVFILICKLVSICRSRKLKQD